MLKRCGISRVDVKYWRLFGTNTNFKSNIGLGSLGHHNKILYILKNTEKNQDSCLAKVVYTRADILFKPQIKFFVLNDDSIGIYNRSNKNDA